ncbi:hypothetical protein, partial [Paraburkholderia dinghuensis]|uniref:hypothetical protein n=1 Tax=Paraburkholderia dinghuensis TaxID=2305225 RepID=UPI001C875FF4
CGTLNISAFLPLGRVYTRPAGRRNFRGSSMWKPRAGRDKLGSLSFKKKFFSMSKKLWLKKL